jgi:hypothetical protein
MRSPRASLVVIAALLLPNAAAPPALAHPEKPEAGEEAEIQALAEQPARVLAQQAHALLHIRDDTHEAGVRLDAALESRDQRQVDVPILRRAAETLDGGDAARAQTLIDEALSRPLGATSGKLFHGAGREFRPATGPQEIVAIGAGSVALLLGLLGLRRARRHVSARPAAG